MSIAILAECGTFSGRPSTTDTILVRRIGPVVGCVTGNPSAAQRGSNDDRLLLENNERCDRKVMMLTFPVQNPKGMQHVFRNGGAEEVQGEVDDDRTAAVYEPIWSTGRCVLWPSEDAH